MGREKSILWNTFQACEGGGRGIPLRKAVEISWGRKYEIPRVVRKGIEIQG